MCGIAGWFSSSNSIHNPLPILKRMVHAIRHRGPDGEGFMQQDHAAFGHCRLAIIDPKHGQQPMTNQDQTFMLTYNGEIYNHAVLRQWLEKKGHIFHTHSDTEVILKLYQHEGSGGFSRLRGMFAFALWDKIKQQGLLVRDSLGIKPLFIKDTADGILFGSEAKALIAFDQKKPEMDLSSLHLIMNFRYIPGEKSLFSGIKQLMPGQILQWSEDGKQTISHLDTPQPPYSSVIDALQDTVQAHLCADTEVGAYLSGGIDSAAIVSMAAKHLKHPVRSFTLDVGDDPLEAKNAAVSAQLLGVENLQASVCTENFDDFHRLIWHLEMPKVNALQVSQLAKHASQHVKVVLSGLGGDEIFYGYNVHRIMDQAHQANRFMPSVISSGLGGAAAAAVKIFSSTPWSESERALRMLHSLGDNWPRVYGLLRNLWDSPKMRKMIYGPRMLDSFLPNAFDTLAEQWPSDTDPIVAMAHFERNHKMVNDLLWQEDRVSMAEGLEVRVPFVDTFLWHTVDSLERNQLMARGQPKSYLRQTLKHVLPEKIRNRPKSGFQVDASTFFNRHLKQLAEDFLSEEKVHAHGLFNPKFIRDIRNRPAGKKLRWHYFMLYLMLMTHLWIEVFQNDAYQQNS